MTWHWIHFHDGSAEKDTSMNVGRALSLLLLTFSVFPLAASAQQSTALVIADFSVAAEHPLVKDKIGVYQTPFMGTRGYPELTAMEPFLAEAGVRDLRYEVAWGKPNAFAFRQIGGTAKAPTVDFALLDPFMTMLHRAHVQPLIAAGYNPLPLQDCSAKLSICWKAPPSDYSGWASVLRQVSAHYAKILGVGGLQYEMWNEPDIVIGGRRLFFTGSVTDYGDLYKAGTAGVQAGAGEDARIGGPAVAIDTSFVTESGVLAQPFDFLSIHGYANYAAQIARLRKAAGSSGPGSHAPLYLTEYGSFEVKGSRNPMYSSHVAAMRFFQDVEKMLEDSDVPKIYWAQWIDDDLGMLDYGLRRKAIFNAYMIYQTMLPVDRVQTTISGPGIGSMAAGDEHTAGVVVWNSSADARKVTVTLRNLPFAKGSGAQWFVDGKHASFADGAPEKLTSGGDSRMPVQAHGATWTGVVEAQSIVYVQATDGRGAPSLSTNPIGAYAGNRFYFSARPSHASANFDPFTSVARLSMGDADTGTAAVGNSYDVAGPGTVLEVEVSKTGIFQKLSADSVFGVRIDFQARSGNYSKSVLYTDGLNDPARTLAFPWGTGKAAVDQVRPYTGSKFRVRLAADAPADWNGHRIIITPLLADAGAGSRARLGFTSAH